MFRYIKQFKGSSRQTKLFILNWLTYGIALVVTTVYCYGRLDFVRSYKTTPPQKTHEQIKKT